jgi:hypothetical protein
MTLEHVNHFEREGVVPIAFCLFHYANVHDASFMLLSGQTPLWNDEWQARVGLSINDHGKHRTVDEMVHQRIGDLDAFAEYMRAVYSRTSAWLEHPPSAPESPANKASPFWTELSVGSTNTAYATWAKSN